MAVDINKKMITVQGINIQCFDAGNGVATIVLLHGAGVDSAMMSWAEVIRLLGENYRVIAPDLPGYGGSDSIDGEYTLEFYTETVKGIIEAFQCPPVVLVGLSLGGGISLNMALNYPELIRLLIPVDAWGLFPKLPYHRLTHWYTRSKLNDNLYQWTGKYPAIVRWSLAYNLFGDKSKVTEALVEEVRDGMLEPEAGKPFISFQRSEITRTGLHTDLYSRLSEIAVPTLLIHGSKDKAVPLKDALAASKLIPNCQLHIMEGCRHWPQKERPEEFARVVGDFIAGQNL
ncbi:Hydrolase, alpha/beta domain protein [Desulfitobacterium hafniense]|uniref:Hydrolase, alpha/beta domain protein n=1 Tax=Desulfitobacterium hafniense TaxID=49338 RepID=A0A098B6M5_DESHA|nr:alpha/beta hydrolase [Desulfitobacterium hafniense]CDX04007.1 Hydrolase, alpha/beta domain protein [Desulfitobacterium hafniense]